MATGPHGSAVFRSLVIHDTASTRPPRRLFRAVVSCNFQRYPDTIASTEEVSNSGIASLGAEHIDTLESRHLSAKGLHRIQSYAEALWVLETRATALGGQHLKTLVSKRLLAPHLCLCVSLPDRKCRTNTPGVLDICSLLTAFSEAEYVITVFKISYCFAVNISALNVLNYHHMIYFEEFC